MLVTDGSTIAVKTDPHLILHWWKVFRVIYNKIRRCCGINPDTELAISNVSSNRRIEDLYNMRVYMNTDIRKLIF